jgi:hypothetical protein
MPAVLLLLPLLFVKRIWAGGDARFCYALTCTQGRRPYMVRGNGRQGEIAAAAVLLFSQVIKTGHQDSGHCNKPARVMQSGYTTKLDAWLG